LSSRLEKVDENREYAIEACIVRLMKARKQMTFEVMIDEVKKSLFQFHPEHKVLLLFYAAY